MSSPWRIRKRTVLVCLLAVFGFGIAAERYRQYWSTNVGDVSVQRTDADIALIIDGRSFTDWHMPATLRAGSHQFDATWRGIQVKTTINVKRDDIATWNRVKYSLHKGQLQVEHNSHLLDVVPRPEPEVFAIQTASGKFWHTADSGEIVLRLAQEPGGAERYTLHWLRPDHSEAFIQSSDGRFLTNLSSPLDASPGSLRLADVNGWPSVFKADRVEDSESWIEFATSRHFVGVDADSKRVRITAYELFASPHLLISATGESNITKPVPLPPAITVAQAASSAPSVRRFKGHTNVIRAVVFTPDGRHIISGSSEGTIRFWNVESGKHVHTIQAHRPVMSLAISGDGKTLASGMANEVVKIWKLQHDSEITHHDERVLSREHRHGGTGPFRHSGDVRSIAFSPDDTKVAAAHNGMRVWNLRAPDERCKSSSIMGPVTSLVWSRTGDRVLMCAEERSLYWWPKSTDSVSRDARSGKILFRSGDHPLVVVGGDILDPETNQVMYTFKQRQGVRAVSAQISARRKLLVTADVLYRTKSEAEPDELVTVWDLTTGRQLSVLRERFGQVGNIAISPNGEHVAYGNGIRETGHYLQEKSTGDYDLRVWKIINDEP
ncbi:MAG: hypothetical protein O3C40_31295 [Planctomycetota bacterium]|nr:hypothetical protein [Planctomycetota bacterium]